MFRQDRALLLVLCTARDPEIVARIRPGNDSNTARLMTAFLQSRFRQDRDSLKASAYLNAESAQDQSERLRDERLTDERRTVRIEITCEWLTTLPGYHHERGTVLFTEPEDGRSRMRNAMPDRRSTPRRSPISEL